MILRNVCPKASSQVPKHSVSRVTEAEAAATKNSVLHRNIAMPFGVRCPACHAISPKDFDSKWQTPPKSKQAEPTGI